MGEDTLRLNTVKVAQFNIFLVRPLTSKNRAFRAYAAALGEVFDYSLAEYAFLCFVCHCPQE